MDNKEKTSGLVILNFCTDNAMPVFKEVSGKDYILYGEKNDYPEFLTSLYNRSAKHNAIINGKCNYILGSGFAKRTPAAESLVDQTSLTADGVKVPAKAVNSMGETIFEVMEKSVKDIEIYGGFRWIIIWNKSGGCDIYHQEFHKLRTAKETGKFYFKSNWQDNKEIAKEYPEFNPDNRQGPQIFAYNEYRPGCDKYPLPGYVGAIDYIQADIEVGGHTYSNAAGGFMASKMVSFFDGNLDEDGMRVVEKRLTEKFTGRKGKKFVLTFNVDNTKKPIIDDLGQSDITKEDFSAFDNLIQQNIFSGHQVTSPSLFGIKTQGQLGITTELKDAYEIFKNTYAKPKQASLEKIVNYFGGLLGLGCDYYIQQLDPIGNKFDIKDVINILPKRYIYESLNIPKEYWDDTDMAGDNINKKGANP